MRSAGFDCIVVQLTDENYGSLLIAYNPEKGANEDVISNRRFAILVEQTKDVKLRCVIFLRFRAVRGPRCRAGLRAVD